MGTALLDAEVAAQGTQVAQVAWQPISAPQEALVTCPIEDVFYGGARGGGKTDGLIGDFVAHAGQYGVHARGILFRRTYPELEEVERRCAEILTPLGWSYVASPKRTWTAPNGATLKLRYLLRDTDAASYQGHSYTWQGWDELTNWSKPDALDKLWATMRSAHGVPCVRRSTGNPGGPGHGWVKQRYIDPNPQGFRVFEQHPNPRDQSLAIETVFIPSTLDDNPTIAASGYEARIAAAAGENEALYEAWRFGRWDVFVGQQYNEIRPEFHVIRGKVASDFAPNTEWFATMDWGHVQGAYGLHAVTAERRVELVWEFYEDFRQLTDYEAALAIMEASKHWPRPRAIYADQQMWYEVGTAVTLAEGFRRGLSKAIPDRPPALIESKHPAKSRAVKVGLIHEWLAVGKDEDRKPVLGADGQLAPWAVPAYRIHERCKNTLRVLREIPADPDNPNDVDPDYAEDHLHDMVGFACSSRPLPPRVKKPPFPEKQPDRAHPITVKDGRAVAVQRAPKTAAELAEWAEQRVSRGRLPHEPKQSRLPRRTYR